jgi:broad specificity phosphatase PhoE
VRSVCNSNPRIGYNLTEKGRAQARALGETLAFAGIDLIVTSEFLRARETAWLANETLNVPQVVGFEKANPAIPFRPQSPMRWQQAAHLMGSPSWLADPDPDAH